MISITDLDFTHFDFDDWWFDFVNSFYSVCAYFFNDILSPILDVLFSSKLVVFTAVIICFAAVSAIVYIIINSRSDSFDDCYIDSRISTPDMTTYNAYPRRFHFTGFYRPFSMLHSLYRYFDNKEKKAELEAQKKAAQEAREKERADAQALADEYFENNQTRMTVSYNGFKFYAPNWYKRNWGNTHKVRTTKYFDKYGNLQIRTSDTETKDVSNEFEQIED